MHLFVRNADVKAKINLFLQILLQKIFAKILTLKESLYDLPVLYDQFQTDVGGIVFFSVQSKDLKA